MGAVLSALCRPHALDVSFHCYVGRISDIGEVQKTLRATSIVDCYRVPSSPIDTSRSTTTTTYRSTDINEKSASPSTRTKALNIPRAELVVAVVAVLGLGPLIFTIASNPEMDWPTVGHYMFSGPILSGVKVTVLLTLISVFAAIIIGTLIAIAQESKLRTLSALASAYIWFFRSVPLLVQILFWFNLGLIWPTLGPPGLQVTTNEVISGMVAAFIALAFHESAYQAEIVRAGLMSVPEGQREAAASLGLSSTRIMRYVVLPQALTFIIPPTGNLAIGALKATSVVVFIGGGDLLTRAANVYSENYRVIPLLIVATIWYLVLVAIMTLGQQILERRFSSERDAPIARVAIQGGEA